MLLNALNVGSARFQSCLEEKTGNHLSSMRVLWYPQGPVLSFIHILCQYLNKANAKVLN